MTPQSVARTSSPLPALRARVSKRLAPGQNGTKRLQAEYGNALVCVRYRQDGRKRHTTVERVIEEQTRPPRAARLEDFIVVAIGYPERELRAQAKQSGARWDAERRLWIMTRDLAKRLGIEDRIQPFTGDAQ